MVFLRRLALGSGIRPRGLPSCVSRPCAVSLLPCAVPRAQLCGELFDVSFPLPVSLYLEPEPRGPIQLRSNRRSLLLQFFSLGNRLLAHLETLWALRLNRRWLAICTLTSLSKRTLLYDVKKRGTGPHMNSDTNFKKNIL